MRRQFLFLLVGFALLSTASQALNARAGGAQGWREGSNLPPPNHWQGSVDDFDPGYWQHGVWRHARHDGRLGWWYRVRMDWFAFEEPVLPYPDMFTPAGYPAGWWYRCDAVEEYYPYVTLCPGLWSGVAPKLLGQS
jgi:hypothetical protein